MYKVAILGCENSHAINFAKLINGGHEMRGGRGIADFRVVGIFGEYDDAMNEKIKAEADVPHIAKSYDEFVGKVDAVLITARHGDNHLKYAKPYLEAKIPIFVDKPITINKDEAIYLAKTAKNNNIPLCGGSCLGLVTSTKYQRSLINSGALGKLVGGCVNAPISLKNEYGDFFFYSQHLVQMVCDVFGYAVKSVFARKRNNTVSVNFLYDGFDVFGFYGANDYSITVYGENRNSYMPIDINTDAYLREIDEFCDMVRSGVMPVSYENLIKPVFILNAINDSINQNAQIEIEEAVI